MLGLVPARVPGVHVLGPVPACVLGWWAGCSPCPGAGVAGPGCGPASGVGLCGGGGVRARPVGRLRRSCRPCGPCACRFSCLVVRLAAGPPRWVGFRGRLCAGFRVGLWAGLVCPLSARRLVGRLVRPVMGRPLAGPLVGLCGGLRRLSRRSVCWPSCRPCGPCVPWLPRGLVCRVWVGLAGFVDAFVVVEAGESVGACGLCGGVVVAAVGGEGVFVEGEVGGVVEGCAAVDGVAVCLGA